MSKKDNPCQYKKAVFKRRFHLLRGKKLRKPTFPYMKKVIAPKPNWLSSKD